MIHLKAICPTGAFSYGFVPVIPLSNCGRVFLLGKNLDQGGSNGSGKSSLLNCIKEVLFSKNDTGKSGLNIVNAHKDWDNGCFVVLWFSDNLGNDWRIIYCRRWKGHPPPNFKNSDTSLSQVESLGQTYTGTDIFLERFENNMWVDERPTSIGNKTVNDTKIKIVEILGMNYTQFSAYVSLGQRAESLLVNGTSGDRERVVESVADVSIWDRASDVVKQKYNDLDRESQLIIQKINGIKYSLENLSIPSDDEIKSLEKEIIIFKKQIAVAITKIREIQNTIANKTQEAASINLEGLDQELDIYEAELRHAREAFINFKKPASPPEISNLAKNILGLESEIKTLNSIIEGYKSLGVGPCQRCRQPVSDDYKHKEINSYQGRLGIISTSKENMDKALAVALKDYNENCERKKVEAEKRFNEETGRIEDSVRRLLEVKNIKVTLESELKVYNSKISEYESSKASYMASVDSKIAYLKSLNSKREEYNKLQMQIDILNKEYEGILFDIEHHKWVERNLKKLKLQEYNAVIDRLNYLVKQELLEMWGSGMIVRFVTAQEKTRGTGVKQELALLVDTPNKSGIPIEMYSGGETKVIILAVFRAMCKLANERGVGVNLIAIDEIDKDLDDVRTDRIVGALEAIADGCSTCLVISHNARLLNTMRFDQTWTIAKQNEMSTIEIN